MTIGRLGGYAGKILRVDLEREQLIEDSVDELLLRKYIGGTGLGAHFLYQEVPPGIEWNHADNRLIFALGPVNGAPIAGSTTYSVVTKGPLTGGGTSTQASGNFGAWLKFSGFDMVIVQGMAKRWLYLYIHDNTPELRDAAHLLDKDTFETEDLIRNEVGAKQRDLSIVAIGPAGENLVRFACIVGDRGHVASKNGVGAVMGSKKLKAIAVTRGNSRVSVKDKDRLSRLNKEMIQVWKDDPLRSHLFWGGTSFLMLVGLETGQLPVRNLTTNVYPEEEVRKFTRQEFEKHLKMTPKPCWACPSHHLHMVEVLEGPYQGLVTEEPDYELLSQTSNLIGNKELGASFMLCDTVDRLGLDGNESGWLIAFVMECYERGIITSEDIGGLEMTWGNVEAARALLRKVAKREGLGNILAEGVKRSAEYFGGEALNIGVYTEKGHAPRGHDHRARWVEELDYATSGVGTIETGPVRLKDRFNPEEVSTTLAKDKWHLFVNSLIMCMFPTLTLVSAPGAIEHLVEILNAVTGWDFTKDEADRQAHRVANVFRVFNLRHGIRTDLEYPSRRYGSTPVDGPTKGMGVMAHWEYMLNNYYEQMGWDRASGRPLPETLASLGLQNMIKDIW